LRDCCRRLSLGTCSQSQQQYSLLLLLLLLLSLAPDLTTKSPPHSQVNQRTDGLTTQESHLPVESITAAERKVCSG
jgi:hypothetical protein